MLIGFVQAQKYAPNQLVIKQGENVIRMSSTEKTIELKQEPFTIQFLNKPYQEDLNLFYAAKAFMTTDPIESNFMGETFDDIPFFSPGTGFAIDLEHYGSFPVLSDEGHQYLYYSSQRNKNIMKVDHMNPWDVYEWTLYGVFKEDENLYWKQSALKTLNILMVIDQNLNEVIDPEESFLLHIHFK